MSAPAVITLKNLSGTFVQNKKLSDDFDSILALQGVGWLTRKALGYATITLTIKEYLDTTSTTHIDIVQSASGFGSTTELRTLNGEPFDHEDKVFGKVKGRSKWLKLSEVEDEYLKKGWLPEMSEEGVEVIGSWVDSLGNGWTAVQIWGFEEVDGERRYVRHVVVTKGKVRKEARLVYDYQGA